MTGAADSVAARQTLLAAYLDDPRLEEWLRKHPEQAATRHGVSLAFAHWLAQIAPARVRQFRRSRAHKQRVRDGKPATQLP